MVDMSPSCHKSMYIDISLVVKEARFEAQSGKPSDVGRFGSPLAGFSSGDSRARPSTKRQTFSRLPYSPTNKVG